jgi:hypothetical protein
MILCSRVSALARRGRAIAHTEAVLTAGMYSLGCAYNFCGYHDSLRLAAPKNAPRNELLLLKVPPAPLGCIFTEATDLAVVATLDNV